MDDPVIAEQWSIFDYTEFLYIRQTISDHKIDCLADIKSTWITTMIRSKKCTNILLCLLISLVYWYPLSHNLSGINHIGNLRHQILITIFPVNKRIELVFVSLRNEVPDFVWAKMIIVERVDLAIFNMPAESSELHAHIEPRDSYTTNVLIMLVTYF